MTAPTAAPAGIARAGTSIDERLAAAGLPSLPRRVWLEIDTDALAWNLGVVRELAPRGAQIAAVVKADAYGHGIEVAARTFRAAGAERLCVASLDEAFAVRRAGVGGPILVLFGIPARHVVEAAEAGLELVASDEHLSRELLAAWREASARDGVPEAELPVHLEVETGLGRAGLAVDAVVRMARDIAATPGVRLGGLWSHLATPDDEAVTRAQTERLDAAIEGLRAAKVPVPPIHLSASGGLFTGAVRSEGMVRPGLCLYGESPVDVRLSGSGIAARDRLRPAMTLKARPLRLLDVPADTAIGYGGRWRSERPSRIATLPVGYGDGFTRTYQPGSEALVRGRRVPLVGTVAMDAVAADVTDVPGVDLGDEFVLLGAQGDDRITASELARRRNTIAWEVVTTMAARVPRVYHAAAEVTGIRTLAGEVLVRERHADPVETHTAGPVGTGATGTGGLDTSQRGAKSGPAMSGGSLTSGGV